MTYLKIICTAIAALVLAGCMTTTSEAPDPRYAGVERQTATALGEVFYFFERPEDGRVLAVVKDNSISSILVYSGSTEANLRQGLQSHYHAGGRTCEIGRGTLIDEGSYEFRYRCKAPTKSVRYCVTEAECRTFAAQGFAVDRSFVGVDPVFDHVQMLNWNVYDLPDEHAMLVSASQNGGDPSTFLSMGVTIVSHDSRLVAKKHLRGTGRGQCELQKSTTSGELAQYFEYKC